MIFGAFKEADMQGKGYPKLSLRICVAAGVLFLLLGCGAGDRKSAARPRRVRHSDSGNAARKSARSPT